MQCFQYCGNNATLQISEINVAEVFSLLWRAYGVLKQFVTVTSKHTLCLHKAS